MATPSSIIPPNISAFLFMIICINVSNPCPHTTAAVDSFENRLHNDVNSIAAASKDYGNILHKTPSFVLDPLSVEDIIDLTRSTFDRTNASYTTIAARGNGHCIRGQDLTHSGVVVNMTALSCQSGGIEIGGNSSSGYYADVGGGKRWIDVLQQTLEHGLAPVSWTDYLHLTVGGTLSNAGISGQAFLHGPQIANVLQLDVVTGKGEFVTCSKSKDSELFFGVLGGLGQFGIITRARIILHKAQKMTRWVRMIYSDFSLFTKDQEYLITTNNNVASYVEGFLIVNASATSDSWRASNFSISNSTQSDIDALLRNNHGLLYSIELAKYYDDQNVIDQEFETLFEKLSFIRGLDFSRDVSLFDFLNRVGNLDMPETGSKLYHPWLNLILPKSNITELNNLVLATKLPTLSRTRGLFILYPINKNKWDDRMSAVTPAGDENVLYTLGLLHSSANDYASFDAFNNQVLDICETAGIQAKQYLPNHKKQRDWMKHFGSFKWKTFYNRKTLFDPNRILSPGQGIFNRFS